MDAAAKIHKVNIRVHIFKQQPKHIIGPNGAVIEENFINLLFLREMKHYNSVVLLNYEDQTLQSLGTIFQNDFNYSKKENSNTDNANLQQFNYF